MERSYYKTPKPGRVMRMLWKAAGGDRYILERATYSDQMKYMCLGGIVATTGAMAALAGGYAFYTIFEPRGSALEHDFDLKTSIMSIAFGLIWGWIIFNIDRFIVTSTGKGDGTEAITWDELKGALPRIVMGAIIALTISKPVEIRMFKSEIDVALHEEQLKAITQKMALIEETYADREQIFIDKIGKLESEIDEKELRASALEDQYIEEARNVTVGPRARAVKAQWDLAVKKVAETKAENDPRIQAAQQELATLRTKKGKEIQDAEKVAHGLDGLLERIKLAHEIAGPVISLFITLLFMAIELTPIFFKLMLTKTPYDYIEENIKELMKAEQGIYVKAEYFQGDGKAQEKDMVRHMNVEKIQMERTELQKVQEELTAHALKKYKEMMQKQIDADPARYVEIKTVTEPKGKQLT